MKPLVIYHSDCTDGYGAAFAAWMKLGDTAEYLSMRHGDEEWIESNLCGDDLSSSLDGRDVYILDFSFDRGCMNWLLNRCRSVVWRDHHKTALEMWCRTYYGGMQYNLIGNIGSADADILLDDNKSGALLAWEYFHPGTEVPLLIQHIDDRDRWQWKMEGSAEIHAALSAMKPWSFEQWKRDFLPADMGKPNLSFDAIASYVNLMKVGTTILRAQKQDVEQMAKQARKCQVRHPAGGDNEWVFANGLAVNAPLHQSEVGHVLANASGTYGLVWYVASDNHVRCSLRSNGKYDVSAIARAFGGGGHRNAAGFETDIETLMEWLK